MQHAKFKNKCSLARVKKMAFGLLNKNNCASQNEFSVICAELNLNPDELVDQEKKIHAKKILEIFKDLDQEIDGKIDKNEFKTDSL